MFEKFVAGDSLLCALKHVIGNEALPCCSALCRDALLEHVHNIDNVAFGALLDLDFDHVLLSR